MKRLSTFLLISFFLFRLQAQILSHTEEVYNERIALMDEFMTRFNKRSVSAGTDSLSRQNDIVNILRLFNLSNFDSPSDPMLASATEFASAAVDNSVTIAYSDTLWTARATCHGTYRNHPVSFILTLRVEPRGSDMYRWAITGAEGELFSLPPIDKGKGFYIFPDAHETNFMALSDMTASQTESIGYYASDGCPIDPLSVFLTMVYGGQLKIDHVQPLEFVFRQVPGWEFTVRHFERDNLNSGWLIDSIIRK